MRGGADAPGSLSFRQVDVFGSAPLRGNPVAVVLGADGLATEQMAALARWTNLSETTFISTPTTPGADYRVRIFTPFEELPFAGHPTLGSAHAWLAEGGAPAAAGAVVQECGVGLVTVRVTLGPSEDRLAFAAPPLLRTGPLTRVELDAALEPLGLRQDDVVGHQWVDNGPGWLGLLLRSAEAVLAVEPDLPALSFKTGIIGPYPAGSPRAFEVRALVNGPPGWEDPVTGSLNASLAQWLRASGQAPPAYRAGQGRAVGADGEVWLDDDGASIWVGGATTTIVRGTISL